MRYKMISLEDFNVSPFEKKCDLITGYTHYISSRQSGETKIYLYHTGDFFIEVYYSPTHKKVLMIYAFNDLKGMEHYIENISLSDLIL